MVMMNDWDICAASPAITEQMEKYNIEEMQYMSTENECIAYIYNSFMNGKSVGIEYNKEIDKPDVKNMIKQVFLLDEDTVYDAEGLWGNMESYNYSIAKDSGKTYIFIKYNEKYPDYEAFVNQWIDDVLHRLSEQSDIYNMEDMEKAQTVHDYLVEYFDYDTSLINNDDYIGIKTGKMVCQGYALLYCKMMNRLSVPCKILFSDSHSWNVLYLDGEWLQVDVSGDDIGHLGIDVPVTSYFAKKTLAGIKYNVIEPDIFFFDENIEIDNITSPIGVALYRLGQALVVIAGVTAVVGGIYTIIMFFVVDKAKKARMKKSEEFKIYNSV